MSDYNQVFGGTDLSTFDKEMMKQMQGLFGSGAKKSASKRRPKRSASKRRPKRSASKRRPKRSASKRNTKSKVRSGSTKRSGLKTKQLLQKSRQQSLLSVRSNTDKTIRDLLSRSKSVQKKGLRNKTNSKKKVTRRLTKRVTKRPTKKVGLKRNAPRMFRFGSGDRDDSEDSDDDTTKELDELNLQIQEIAEKHGVNLD